MGNAGAEEPQPQPEQKSRNIYLFLAFFLGVFGIHNFYANRRIDGAVQAALTGLALVCFALPWFGGKPADGPALLMVGFVLLFFAWLKTLCEMLFVSRDGRGISMRRGSNLLCGTLAFLLFAGPAVLMAGGPLLAKHLQKRSRDDHHILACRSRMKQIGLGLKLYADGFDGRLPPQDNADGLELLRSTGILPWHGYYVCPSSTTMEGSGEEPLTEANCDYIYLGGLTTCHDWIRDCPVIFERPGSHSKARINILYGDGRVNIVRLPDTVQTVTDLLEYLAGQTDDPDVKAFLLRKRQTFF